MLDRYVRQFLRGRYSTAEPDYESRGTLASYLLRFRLLLQSQAAQIDAIASPNGFSYSPCEKLDRLLWIAGWGATFYSENGAGNLTGQQSWTSVSELPESSVVLAGAGSMASNYIVSRARVVFPSSFLGSQQGNIAYANLTGTQQSQIQDVLQQAEVLVTP